MDVKRHHNFLGNLLKSGVAVLTKSAVWSETHTYAMLVDGSSSTVFVPFAVAIGSGEALALDRAVYRCNSGTPTVKVQKGGVDVTGFTGMSVTTTQAETNPTDVTLADKDELKVVCTAGTWTGWIYVTLVFKRTQT